MNIYVNYRPTALISRHTAIFTASLPRFVDQIVAFAMEHDDAVQVTVTDERGDTMHVWTRDPVARNKWTLDNEVEA